MFSLLRRDYLNLGWAVVLYGLISLEGLLFDSNSIQWFFISGIMMTCLVLSSRHYDDRNTSEILMHSLPVTRLDMIKAKYMAFLIAGSVIFSIAVLGEFFLVQPLEIGAGIDLFSIYLGIVVAISVAVPVCSYLKSGIVSYIMAIVFTIGTQLAVVFSGVFGQSGFVSEGIVTMMSLFMLFVSYLISAVIYKKKEI